MTMDQQKAGPITLVVTHLVAPKHQEAFKKSLQQLMSCAQKYTGYMGSEIAERNKDGNREYNIFYRFDNFEHYCKWNDSAEKKALVDTVHQYTVKSVKKTLSGLENWFALSADKPMVPPPKYKMAISSWLGVYTLLILIFTVFGNYLNGMPVVLRFLLVSMVVIGLMTYVVMPVITRLLAWWLYPKEQNE